MLQLVPYIRQSLREMLQRKQLADNDTVCYDTPREFYM